MTVDQGEVAWLKEGATYVAASDATLAGRWGAAAIESEIVSPLALLAGAETEAARQLAFLGGPLAEETHDVPGSGVELIGTVQTIVAADLGYAAGVDVYVIGAVPQEGVDRTTLTVLRRLS